MRGLTERARYIALRGIAIPRKARSALRYKRFLLFISDIGVGRADPRTESCLVAHDHHRPGLAIRLVFWDIMRQEEITFVPQLRAFLVRSGSGDPRLNIQASGLSKLEPLAAHDMFNGLGHIRKIPQRPAQFGQLPRLSPAHMVSN
jgi:hypothetical protein